MHIDVVFHSILLDTSTTFLYFSADNQMPLSLCSKLKKARAEDTIKRNKIYCMVMITKIFSKKLDNRESMWYNYKAL